MDDLKKIEDVMKRFQDVKKGKAKQEEFVFEAEQDQKVQSVDLTDEENILQKTTSTKSTDVIV